MTRIDRGAKLRTAARTVLYERVRGLQPVATLVHRHGPAARRVSPSLRARVVSPPKMKELEAVRVFSLPNRELVAVPLPPSGFRGSSRAVARKRRRVFTRPFAAEMPNMLLVGRHATPVTRQGNLILSPFGHNVSMLDPVGDRELARPDLWHAPDIVDLEEQNEMDRRPLVSLVGRLDSNYYHWLADFCTQFEAIERYEQSTGERVRLLIRARAPAFVRPTLAALDYGEDDVVEWPPRWNWEAGDNASIRMCVPRLVIPSPRSASGITSFSALRWVRQALLTSILDAADDDSPGGGRLFVHRRPSGWRSIANDGEVLRVVEDNGFRILCPEDLTLEDQVRTFASAEAVVGLHGAGLTNVLFSPRVPVMEIAGNYGGLEYAAIATAVGCSYSRFRAGQRDSDLVSVDAMALSRALGTLLDSRSGRRG